MDQKEQAFVKKTSKTEVDGITKFFIFQIVADNTVDKPGFSSVVDLTDDAWLLVFDYLAIEDRTRIAMVCRRWRELARMSWKSITKLSFENLFERTLDNDQLKNRTLEVIVSKCGTHLQSLSLSFDVPYTRAHRRVHSISSRALELVGLGCTSLQELNLSKVSGMTMSQLNTLVERLPRLKSLDLNRCSIKEEGLGSALQMPQSLTSLNVAGNRGISGELFSQAPQSLTEVFADYCDDLTDNGVHLLAVRCPNLETIDISSCWKLTGLSITALTTNCPKLKIFKFGLVRFFERRRDTALTSLGSFLTLSKLPLLEELHMDEHTAVTDEVFRKLGRHCPLLQSLSCSGCKYITDAATFHLSPCLHLESIDLSETNVTDEGLIQLSIAHSELKKVCLRRCDDITDEGVGRLLLAHPNLLELDLTDCENVPDRVLPLIEDRLEHRTHTQRLIVRLRGTAADPERAFFFADIINCDI